MADGGKSTVTTVKPDRMAVHQSQLSNSALPIPDSRYNALALPSPSRPILSSHNSSSVPSTPHSYPRRLSDEYRTPSPMARSHDAPSPRSSRSGSESTVRSSGRPPFPGASGGCIFETGMAFSRRRIPYSVGGEVLEPQSKVKKSLDPADEEKLSGDMRELYDRILPSADSDLRRAKLMAKLDKILNGKWPGNNIKVHVFGSSGNLLCSHDSDVDVCITTTMKGLEKMCLLAKTLAEEGMQRVVCVPHAKVPIVKIWDPDLQLACDMNVNNTLALENTRMIRTYVQIDPRVRQLAMVLKHWTRKRVLNDAALGGTLSSYTWICLIINFLQTRKPKPILPALQQRPHQRRRDENGILSSFADDIESLKGFGRANKETIGELLFHFFRRYGHELDFEKHVISVRTGGLLSKKEKGWHLMQNNRLCVEEPFNTDRNLGNTADDISFRGVHDELRRAFDLISQGKLTEACEDYEFPLEKEKVFVRPAPQPRPVLTRSLSQGRKSGNTQVNTSRNSATHKTKTGSSRRASSAVSSSKLPALQNVQGQRHVTLGAEASSGNQIHDQLFQHFQMLQVQKAQLWMQMHQAQANLHAQATAQIQPLHMPASAYPKQGGFDTARGHPSVDSGPLSAPLRTVQGLYYPVSMMSPSQNSSRSPQPNMSLHSITNPPSPSIGATQPINGEPRRSLQRSIASGNTSPAARSHSQPPSNNVARFGTRPSRAMPITPLDPAGQGKALPLSLHQYQQQYMATHKPAEKPPMHTVLAQQHAQQPAHPDSLLLRPPIIDGSEDGPSPRPYVAYYLDRQPRPETDRNGLVSSIPSFQDIANLTRHASASPNLSRLHAHASRSCSPSPSYRQSPQEPKMVFETKKAQNSNSSPVLSSTTASVKLPELSTARRIGPVIVDGSSDASEFATPPESISMSITQSESTSFSDDPACDTPSSTSVATSYEHPDVSALDQAEPTRPANSASSVLQFGDFPAHASLRTIRPSLVEEQKQVGNIRVKSSPKISMLTGTEQPNGLGINLVPFKKETSGNQASIKPTEGSESMKSSSSIASSHEAKSTPIPLLSPVREVITPSPTATRNNNQFIRENFKAQLTGHRRASSVIAGEKLPSSLHQNTNAERNVPKIEELSASFKTVSNDSELSNSTQHYLQAQGPPENHSTSSSPRQASHQPSEWQSVGHKKNKKNRKANSMGSVSLMQERGERKGG